MRGAVFYWNPFALPNLVVGIVAVGLGALVYLARPDRLQNRILGFLLFLEGLATLCGFFVYSSSDPDVVFGAQMAQLVSYVPVMLCYPLLVGTLHTPLALPFSYSASRVAIATVALGFVALALQRPERIVLGFFETPYSRFEILPGPWLVFISFLTPIVFLYGLAAALSAVARARPGTATRARTKAFAVGFGLRDVVLAATLPLANYAFDPTAPRVAAYGAYFGFITATAVLVLVLGYGILKHQLFDIDLKLKWTLKRGTLASMFLGVFFIVTVMVENFLTGQYGWVWGGLAAGLLLFALGPLQRVAQRIADTAMPGVKDTAAYREFRKLEVYKAALEGAAQDRVITEKERAILAGLQRQLGISAADARSMERDVLEATHSA